MENEAQSQGQMQEMSTNAVHEGNPYFLGEHALVKFSGGEEGYGPGVYWLVDKENRTIRPFESTMALDAVFGEELQTALQNVMNITPPMVDQNNDITEGVLSGFSILGPEYAIKEDGTSKPLEFSSHQLKGRYGKAIDEGLENLATEAVDGFLSLLVTNEPKTNIPATFVNQLKNDNKLMAYYISAMAYGGYSLGDIYSDISRRFHNSK